MLDDIANNVGQPGRQDAMHDPHFLVKVVHQSHGLTDVARPNGLFGQGLAGDAQGGKVVQAQHPVEFLVEFELEQG